MVAEDNVLNQRRPGKISVGHADGTGADGLQAGCAVVCEVVLQQRCSGLLGAQRHAFLPLQGVEGVCHGERAEALTEERTGLMVTEPGGIGSHGNAGGAAAAVEVQEIEVLTGGAVVNRFEAPGRVVAVSGGQAAGR